ncbi:MAG TPA: ATP-binding protein [Casimicrobiaceae bacterium]|nr:ATP-binding protein [Casimicrobiaceae bacterium]
MMRLTPANSANARRTRWWSGIVLLIALLGASVASAANGVEVLDIARFVPGAAQPDGTAGDAHVVRLPHAVSLTDATLTGDAWYLLGWNVHGRPARPQAIYITATSIPMQVYVNGNLIGSTGPLDGRRPRSYEQSTLFTVPVDSLAVGRNVIALHVRMRSAEDAGIGPVLAGDATALHRHAIRDLVAYTFGPAAVSVATFSMGLFILVLWLRRRDPAYALFGFAALLWSVHTIVTLLPDTPLPAPHWGILWHGGYVLFVALLCLFCLRFTGLQWPAYRRSVIGYTILVVPALYVANAAGVLRDATLLVRFGALALVLIALAAVGRYSARTRNVESALLLAAGGVSAAFALHDWMASHNPLAIRPLWLVPYAALAFLMLVGYILADRFVRALNASERANAELEERVLQKSAALQQQLAVTQAAREAAEHAREIAETANLAKTRFLAAASHDLRQPLHALGMFSQALAQHTHDAEGRALVARITSSVDALEALFSALLDISKLDAGAVVAHPVDFPVRGLLERIADDAAPEALERGLKLAIVAGEGVVRSDPVLLERIVRNLVANALRYTRHGGVLIGCRPRADAYSIEVWDTGPGIAAGEREHIFEEFYQIDNPGRDRSLGLGLGLAIVRRLAALLDHRIELASREGRGSVFRVLVPAGDRSRVTTSEAGPVPAGVSLAGRRVLVLDDEKDVRDATSNVLRQWRCVPIAAATIAEAQQALRAAGPADLMIVDYRLRDASDGLAAIRLLQQEFGASMRAVLVSGESAPDKLARIQESGVPLLHKPVASARLRSVLMHLLASTTAAERPIVQVAASAS